MKMKLKIRLLVIIMFIYQHSLFCGAKSDRPEAVGNFLLTSSQQPSTLYGFGQNIVDKHDVLLFTDFWKVKGKHKNLTELFPRVLYGIRDDLSILFVIPAIINAKDGADHSHGVGDISIECEYAFLNKETKTTALQGTIVGNITFPTGLVTEIPNTGFGAPSFFLAATLAYTQQWWGAWIQGGAVLTTTHNKTKVGNQFLYQGGVECCFGTRPGWIFAGIIDLFGSYEQKNKMCGKINNNSGENTFWIGPSLSVSSEKLIIQLGIAAPVVQHLFGEQEKNHYFLGLDIGYKFL